ncbi:hypothetical protein [Clostridium vincentii]|uniref:hypothetical protein n=1 Tax=Clostridium vincentii TaxID=52704 RepID=UPI0014757432|nr:hypothetical protein [Clostridium vincentii]
MNTRAGSSPAICTKQKAATFLAKLLLFIIVALAKIKIIKHLSLRGGIWNNLIL